MEILGIIKWPLTIIIISLLFFLLLKREIKDILSRVTKIGYGDVKAEVGQQSTEDSAKALPSKEPISIDKIGGDIELVKKERHLVDTALGIFSQETIAMAKNTIEQNANLDDITDSELKADILFKYSQSLYLVQFFDRIYNQLYGSQIYILDYLNPAGRPIDEVKSFYDAAKSQNPAFYENYSFENYLNFLMFHLLIVKSEAGIINITIFGRDFLKFIIQMGKTQHKKY